MHATGQARDEDGVRVVEGEHHLQLELIRELEDAVRLERDPEETRILLSSLVDFSKLHFRTEEVLMAMHRYPEHRDHEAAHASLVLALESVQQAFGQGRKEKTLDEIEALREILVEHIRSRDLALHHYLSAPEP